MVQRGDRASFAFEAGAQVVALGDVVGEEDFDGDVAVKPCVACFVHFPHTAGADTRDDFVGTEFGASGEGDLRDRKQSSQSKGGHGMAQTRNPEVASEQQQRPPEHLGWLYRAQGHAGAKAAAMEAGWDRKLEAVRTPRDARGCCASLLARRWISESPVSVSPCPTPVDNQSRSGIGDTTFSSFKLQRSPLFAASTMCSEARYANA